MDELKEIKIVSRWDSSKILICGKYESVKDCLEKNKGADLRGADLEGANLRGAYLEGADLIGAKNYSGSHDFAQEIIRRQNIDHFTDEEWSAIGKVLTHRLCWGEIKEIKAAQSTFEKLSKAGFDEFEKKFRDKE